MSEQDPGGFEARIRELAYLLWESSGRQYGHALEYWLAAEREVLRSVEQAESRLLGIAAADSKEEAAGAATPPPVGRPAPDAKKPDTKNPDTENPGAENKEQHDG